MLLNEQEMIVRASLVHPYHTCSAYLVGWEDLSIPPSSRTLTYLLLIPCLPPIALMPPHVECGLGPKCVVGCGSKE
jgi:hypothetical protein